MRILTLLDCSRRCCSLHNGFKNLFGHTVGWKRRYFDLVFVSSKTTVASEWSTTSQEMADGENPVTPTFNGRHVFSVEEKRSTISNRSDNYLLEDLHLQHSKSERRFLQPLLVAMQRQSEILKEVVEKQKKIIRGLWRRLVSDQIGVVLKNLNFPFRSTSKTRSGTTTMLLPWVLSRKSWWVSLLLSQSSLNSSLFRYILRMMENHWSTATWSVKENCKRFCLVANRSFVQTRRTRGYSTKEPVRRSPIRDDKK